MFKTKSVVVSGAICGQMWMPQATGGLLFNGDLIGYGGFDKSEQFMFREVLLGMLTRHGGDFQNAQFTADTVVRIERVSYDGKGRSRIHVKEREVSTLPDCEDLVNNEAYVSDFLGDE